MQYTQSGALSVVNSLIMMSRISSGMTSISPMKTGSLFNPMLFMNVSRLFSVSPYEKSIIDKLSGSAELLNPAKVVVEDRSGGCGANFYIMVESPVFKGMPRIRQHRLVQDVLKEDIAKWHAVSIETRMDTFNVLGIVILSECDLLSLNDLVIKRAYRKLALKLHPDKNSDDINAEAKFHQLKVAHDALMNISRRDELIKEARAYLQRKKEYANRNIVKRKFAEELDKKDITRDNTPSTGSASNNNEVQRIAFIRQEHRNMIDSLLKNTTPVFPAPDDANMDLQYWIDYALKEPPDLTAEKQTKFMEFILKEIKVHGIR